MSVFDDNIHNELDIEKFQNNLTNFLKNYIPELYITYRNVHEVERQVNVYMYNMSYAFMFYELFVPSASVEINTIDQKMHLQVIVNCLYKNDKNFQFIRLIVPIYEYL